MGITLADELPIERIPETENWSENYAIMFGDAESGVSAFFSCGRVLSDPTVFREVIGVMLPGGRILYAKNYGRQLPERGAGASMAALTVSAPGQTLRLSYDGPMLDSHFDRLCQEGTSDGSRLRVRVDLTFEAITPVWDMVGESKEAATIAGSMHIEQIGRANGAIDVGGERFRITDGYTVRDHSRGVRNISPYKSHCWSNGPLGDGRFYYLYGMQLQGSEGLGMSNAVISDGDRIVPATLYANELLRPDVDPLHRYAFGLSSEIGDYAITVNEVAASIPCSMISPYDIVPGWLRGRPAAHLFDQLVKYDCNGRECTGWLERGYTAQPL